MGPSVRQAMARRPRISGRVMVRMWWCWCGASATVRGATATPRPFAASCAATRGSPASKPIRGRSPAFAHASSRQARSPAPGCPGSVRRGMRVIVVVGYPSHCHQHSRGPVGRFVCGTSSRRCRSCLWGCQFLAPTHSRCSSQATPGATASRPPVGPSPGGRSCSRPSRPRMSAPASRATTTAASASQVL